MMRRLRVAAFAALSLAASLAWAGAGCSGAERPAAEVEKSFLMAETTLAALSPMQDDIVLIARIGSDLSEYGLTYSHMAFAVREHVAGAWTIVHKLNDCGTASSKLFDQGLLPFFSDSPFRYQAGIWRLAPALQQRLKRVLQDPEASRYHEAHYSLLAYPFSTKYQNSNGWVLETLAGAMAPEGSLPARLDAQGWLLQEGYAGSELHIGTFKRLGARVTKANVEFDDHPGALRWSGRIQTVTVDSVLSWLGKRTDGCLVASCPEMRVVLPAP